jgi:pyrroline-5-carboxylate reductase
MKLGFIGLGNMAKAILAGLLRSGVFSAGEISGYDVLEAVRNDVASQYGICTEKSNAEIAAESDVLILAVKPQFLEGVLTDIAPFVKPDTLIISIAAGKSLGWLHEKLNTEARIIRLMPNTAAMVGEAVTAVCRDAFATDDDVKLAVRICESFGTAQVIDEKLMDAFSALGGSSGAFAFLYMEALADGAVAAGMPRGMAYEVAAQATLGAAKLMRDSKEHPGVLKDMVCSPGGTTIQGIKALENGGVRGGVMAAIEACVEQAKKL